MNRYFQLCRLCRLCLVIVAVAVQTLAWADIVVEDDLGNTVTLKKPAQRIVALAPHLVENLFAAGGG